MTTQSPTEQSPTAGHHPPPAAVATAIVIGLTAVLAILAIAFALPATKSKPNDVPIGIAGPQAATGQVAAMLDQKAPGAFSVTYYPGAESLREAILDRQVYGGLAFGADGPQLLTATGASPAVAQLLTQIGTGIGAQTGAPPAIEDLVPLSPSQSAGLAASALPITLAAILPAFALVFALKDQVWTRFAAAVAFSALMGVTIAALLRYPLGSVEQNFWGVAGGLTLGIGAALLFMLGLGSLFGKGGLGIGALLAVLIGNPLSGLTSAPEMLPAGWGTLGQLLPQGANATLLRSTAYFGGSGAGLAIVVLACWALAGTVLVGIAAARRT